MLRGAYEEDQRPLMHATVVRDERGVFEAPAMNDVVVNRGATSGMVELRVEVGGQFVANQRADGLIIASPTGIDGIFAVRWRPDASSINPRLGAGSYRTAYAVQPPHRALRCDGSGR